MYEPQKSFFTGEFIWSLCLKLFRNPDILNKMINKNEFIVMHVY